MDAPSSIEQGVAVLVYTRKRGWAVATPHPIEKPADGWKFYVRPGAAQVYEYEILAYAELPPVPKTAA